MKHYATTWGEAVRERLHQQDTLADDPTPPTWKPVADAEWRMCGSAALDGRLYWFWECEST